MIEEVLLRHEASPTSRSAPIPDRDAGPLLGVLVARTHVAGVPGRSSLRRVPVVLGSGEGVDLVLDDPSVSAPHAELGLKSGVWFLRDLGSRVGSWVDGERVEGAAPVAPGSTLRFGEIELVLVPHDRWEHSDVIPELAADLQFAAGGPRHAAPQAMLALESATPEGPSRIVWGIVAAMAALALVAFLVWGR